MINAMTWNMQLTTPCKSITYRTSVLGGQWSCTQVWRRYPFWSRIVIRIGALSCSNTHLARTRWVFGKRSKHRSYLYVCVMPTRVLSNGGDGGDLSKSPPPLFLSLSLYSYQLYISKQSFIKTTAFAGIGRTIPKFHRRKYNVYFLC